MIIDGLPVIKAARGEWQNAAKTQISTLLSSFGLPISGTVQYVRGLYTNDGRYKAEVGLDRVSGLHELVEPVEPVELGVRIRMKRKIKDREICELNECRSCTACELSEPYEPYEPSERSIPKYGWE